MCVISTAEVTLPGIANLLLVTSHNRFRVADQLWRQGNDGGQRNRWIQPELGLAVWMRDVNVHPFFFA
jgi:hypothetical protein